MNQKPAFSTTVFFLAVVSLVVSRLLIGTIPWFKNAMMSNPALNLGSGLLSDISLAAVLYAMALVAEVKFSKTLKWFYQIFFSLCAAALVILLTIQLRYLEHFGMTIRPYHIRSMNSLDVWSAGTSMVMESWRAKTVLIFAILVAVLIWKFWRRPRMIKQKKLGIHFAAALVVFVFANSSVIAMRHHRNVHPELRYNAVLALYHSYKNHRDLISLPEPSIEQGLVVRKIMPGNRSYPIGSEKFPLWQSKLPEAPTHDDSSFEATRGTKDLAAALRKTIQSDQLEKPWNIVIVLSESLRAHELSAFGPVDETHLSLTPGFQALAREGIRFTETISSGNRTAFGEAAAICSLYGANDLSILTSHPMAKAVCLPDIFASKGYETYFFYPAENTFDNQQLFYSNRGVAHQISFPDFPKTAAKGGWGFSDKALFDLTRQHLSTSRKPFFSIILTLTNHAPRLVPADAPGGLIDRTLTVEDQVLQYVDWATYDFYTNLIAEHPHTIFIILADHGRTAGEPISSAIPDGNTARTTSRIPWILVVPGLEDLFRGRSVDTLTSNVDLPPTLIKLLGWENTPQQFMGQDVFTRVGPVYTDWQGHLLEITQPGPRQLSLRLVDKEISDMISTIGRFHLFAP